MGYQRRVHGGCLRRPLSQSARTSENSTEATMSAHSISRLAKPKMRGLLTDQIKKHLLVSTVLSVLSAYAYKVMVGDPRKQTYAEFYRNYDVEKEFEKMREAGIFTSCRPKEE